MEMGNRLRSFREAKKMSQGDLERHTGLKRCYISRVENGHTVPSLDTLEKYAGAYEIPLFRLFYEGDEPPPFPILPKITTVKELSKGKTKQESAFLGKLFKSLHSTSEGDRRLFLALAQKLTSE